MGGDKFSLSPTLRIKTRVSQVYVQGFSKYTALKATREAACFNSVPFPPPPGPNASYIAVGLNQRCLEGQFVALAAGGVYRREQRALATTPAAQACYVRCGQSGYHVPFHFSVVSTDGCWCCGATCTLIADPTATVSAQPWSRGWLHGCSRRRYLLAH